MTGERIRVCFAPTGPVGLITTTKKSESEMIHDLINGHHKL